mmetsp:Transcript_74086/g.178928  ORF Transcript_74086/g.178928 Transcript_74086/m.178928 type:complete len:342 (+) Transcript_74086:24-1049(+)
MPRWLAEQELRVQAAKTYSLLFDEPLPICSSQEQWVEWAEQSVMATIARVEVVAPPPTSALTNGWGGGRNGSPTGSGSGSGSAPALEYLMPGSTMHAADLGYPAEGRGGALGNDSSSEERSRRTEVEGGCLPASSSSSSTLEDFMTRRRQTTAGASSQPDDQLAAGAAGLEATSPGRPPASLGPAAHAAAAMHALAENPPIPASTTAASEPTVAAAAAPAARSSTFGGAAGAGGAGATLSAAATKRCCCDGVYTGTPSSREESGSEELGGVLARAASRGTPIERRATPQEGCGRRGRSPLGESFVRLSDSSTDDMPPKPTHGVRVAKGWSPCSRTGGAGSR